METILVPAEKPYNVIVGSSLLGRLGFLLENLISSFNKIIVISDSTVFSLYGNTVIDSFENTSVEVIHYVFPAGELSKNKENYFSILEWLSYNSVTRKDVILALGGGVTGDLAGFVASTYLRGIDYIHVPTTLLAAVDSSVGGKTGINLSHGKNLVGTFWQPLCVVCDVDTFQTLSPVVFADGVAEMIKYGCIWDEKLFKILSTRHWIKEDLQKTVSHCIKIKAEIVGIDERESNLRQILNFGHTLGHAIEQLSGYTLSHGHCVALGMVLITKAGEKSNMTLQGVSKKIEETLNIYHLSTRIPYSLEELIDITKNDKKRSGNLINAILVKNIGEYSIHSFSLDDFYSFLKGAF